MASSEKRKGSLAERLVVEYLRAHGFPQARRTQAGTRGDIGDIDGVPGFAIEVKNHARLDLAGWVAQMLAEMEEKGVDNGVVIAKKRGTTDPGEWYAITPLRLWAKMLEN